MKPAAFQATFSDFKLIKGRKVAQIVLEVDISAADAALETLGGVPRPDKEAWVAVARINPEKAVSVAPTPTNDAPKERRPFGTLPLSQQAALRCQDEAFIRFLSETRGLTIDDPAVVVRVFCGVNSRADIRHDTQAGQRWLLMESAYQAWVAEAAHV